MVSIGQEPRTFSQAVVAQAIPAWDDLYENHGKPWCEARSQTSQENLSTEILDQLKALHSAGQQVVWLPGWNMGVREHREVLFVAASPMSQPNSGSGIPCRAAADTLELAELLELHRDGNAVNWPVGWSPMAAAEAIHALRGAPLRPLSRPEPG